MSSFTFASAPAPGASVEIVDAQAAVIRRIFSLNADEGMTSRQIADRLN